jgi:hypothetical protein
VDLESIKAKISTGSYNIAFTHTEKLRRRRIRAQDIEEAIKVGKIIEDYPNDPRGPSCLILGSAAGKPLHVLCGCLEAETLLIITAYEPDPEEWEYDWQTRRTRP